MGPLIFLLVTVSLGSMGYYLLIRDIKKGIVTEKNLVSTSKAHYWLLLLFVAGLTTISIEAIQQIWKQELNFFMKFITGTILMVMYFMTFIVRPSKYLIRKYKK